MLIVSLVLMQFLCASGRDRRIDSLHIVLDTAEHSQAQARAFNWLAHIYTGLSLDSAEIYVDKAIRVSRNNALFQELGFAYRFKGIIHFYAGELNSAIQYFDSSLVIKQNLDDIQGQVLLMNNIAYAYQTNGDNSKAKRIFFEALELASRNEFILNQGDICNNLGLLYQSIDELDSARYYYSNALKFNEQAGRLSEVALIKNNLGNIWYYQGKYLEALSNFRSAYTYAEEANALSTKYLALENITTIYTKVGLHENAIGILQEVYDYYAEIGVHEKEIATLSNLANALYANNEYQLALLKFKELEKMLSSSELSSNANFSSYAFKCFVFSALALVKVGNDSVANLYFGKIQSYDGAVDRYTKAVSLNGQAEYLMNQGELGYAEKVAFSVLELNQIDSFPDILSDTYKHLADIQHLKGDSVKAKTYQAQADDYHTTYRIKEDAISILRDVIEFDLGRKELEIKVKEQENIIAKNKIANLEAQRRNAFFYAASGLLIFSVLLLWWFGKQKSKRKRAEDEAVNLKLANENEKLRSASLERELELKQKEIVSHALLLAERNEAIKELKVNLVTEFKVNPSKGLQQGIKSIENKISAGKDWDSFRVSFESVHEGFFDKLKINYPALTPRELQLCALLRLNMSIKQMSSILGISEEGVKKARYRIRKKLELTSSKETLTSFMTRY